MKDILILGAGMSATTMIKYLAERGKENNWNIKVGDKDIEKAKSKFSNSLNLSFISIDVNNESEVETHISNSDIVISYVPAFMHPIVAKYCVKHKKHMVTASYVSKELREMEKDVISNGLIFLNELGVDPGIDHMSAMKIIDQIKHKEGTLLAFYSNTGGLIAPESDNNPWHYKFTWNPRNVVLAGQGGVARYRENGSIKYIPYQQLFKRTYRIKVLDYGEFDVYANRDSLIYEKLYGIEGIPTLFRGTLRRPPYCSAWDIFVQLGLTDNTYNVEGLEKLTYRDFINMYLPYHENLTVEEKICKLFNIKMDSEEMNLLKFTGIFEKKPINLKEATPAQILQNLLEQKWKLEPGDKDMIVMQHVFIYELNKKKKKITSSLVVIGKDEKDTAMAITVGMPTAFAVEMLMKGEFNEPGIHVPVTPNLYIPILEKLEKLGIKFIENEEDL
ncbi:MAG: saccharopine dehydrogenase NADP-binding domain-containing protein [Bacteroidales bacterium]|nr:saccharopine dehydrogenase NADP-binding domain-containing protein [Bacteroidales bacterium]